jgi:hypothetical protein
VVKESSNQCKLYVVEATASSLLCRLGANKVTKMRKKRLHKQLGRKTLTSSSLDPVHQLGQMLQGDDDHIGTAIPFSVEPIMMMSST